MAETYQIITDSSCDLSPALTERLNVRVVPLLFSVDGKTYRNDTSEQGMDAAEFYNRLRAGAVAQTSGVNPESFADAMRPALSAGKDVLYIGFSSALSTTYQSACIAAEELREEFPERKILTVDSLCASLGQGLLVYLAAQMQQQGLRLEELQSRLFLLRFQICHCFTLKDLLYLKRGGRISAATALAGTVLGVQPVMRMDDEGRLEQTGKIRGHKNAMRMLAGKVAQEALRPEEQTVFICHGGCPADAEFIAEEIRRQVSVKQIIVECLGPVIGAHTGPDVVSVFYVGEHR